MDGAEVAKTIVGAAVKGAASGGGTIGTPFRAINTAGNAIGGIAKNTTKFYSPNKNKKSRFRKKI